MLNSSASRRDFLQRTLGAALSIPGTSTVWDSARNSLSFDGTQAASSQPASRRSDLVRVGVVGVGSRGSHLMRSFGYWPAEMMRKAGYSAPPQKRIPGVEIVAVSDVYLPRTVEARATVRQYGGDCRAYLDWRELVSAENVDAVVIATADLWHSPVAIAAVEAGKAVYVEKCMSQSIEEAKRLRDAVRARETVLQVGHQNRHSNYHKIARKLIEDGVLGEIHLVCMSMARGSTDGSYRSATPADFKEDLVNWECYQPPSKASERDPQKLFSWRCYWDYSTGISGDLLSHEVDALRMLTGVGVPASVCASGGRYVWHDGRETPDLYSVTHEYPEKNLSMVYSATLGSSYDRKTIVMGRDATLVLGLELSVFPDVHSTRYSEQLSVGKFSPNKAFIHFEGPTRDPKLVTSPTLAWAEGKGLTFTEVGGQKFDVTRLAIEEFIANIRENRKPICDVQEGFAVSATCVLGTESYRAGTTKRWDAVREVIV